MQRSVKRSKSTGSKSKPKKVGRPRNQLQASNVKQYMGTKQKYMHKSKYIDPRQVAKIPQILQDIGELQTVKGGLTRSQYKKIIDKIKEVDPSISRQEADAGIQEYKGEIRQKLHYGGYDTNNLIESQKKPQQLINNLLIPQSQRLTKEADVDNNQNINARFDQPSHDVSSKRQQSAPDPSIYDSDDERASM
ncbi:MAG: hypothetical protein EZS28_041822, partial [Streblomastix strix]